MTQTTLLRQAPGSFNPDARAAGMSWHHRVRDAWLSLPPSCRSPRALGTAGLVFALMLLLAFHQVLVGAMHRAEARQAAWANRAYAMQRCAALPDPEMRASCRTRAVAGVVPAEPPLETRQLAQID